MLYNAPYLLFKHAKTATTSLAEYACPVPIIVRFAHQPPPILANNVTSVITYSLPNRQVIKYVLGVISIIVKIVILPRIVSNVSKVIQDQYAHNIHRVLPDARSVYKVVVSHVNPIIFLTPIRVYACPYLFYAILVLVCLSAANVEVRLVI